MLSFIPITSALLAAAIALRVAWKERRSAIYWSFVAGMAALGFESVFSGLSLEAVTIQQKADWLKWNLVSMSFLPGLWLFFSLTYARGNYDEFLRKWRMVLLAVSVGLPLLTVIFRNDLFAIHVEAGTYIFALAPSGMALYFCFLASAILVLMNLEKTFRASVGTMRWRIKYMIIGLGVLFVARGYTSSQCILFHAISPSLKLMSSSALGLSCLIILRSLFRAGYFEVNAYPSQAVIHNSLTVLVAGAYLLVVGLLAKSVSVFGGATAFPLKAFFVLLAIVVLTLLLLSDRLRLRTRRFVSRHFQRPLYNYRTVWKSFAETTASCLDQTQLCQSVIRLISDIFQVLSVSIWVIDDSKEKLRLAASSNLPASGENVIATLEAGEMAEILRALQLQVEPADIDSSKENWAVSLRKLHPIGFAEGGHRLCVPMIAGGELQGVITIGDRVTGLAFSGQDLDLLKCAGDQTAASLLNIQLSHKLVQAKELEAFQTMSAFFVHDLKNTASTLSLMLQNFATHYNDPAFKEDALRGISKSVHHIDDLIKRLSLFRQKAVSGMNEFELNELVNSVLADLQFDSKIKVNKNLGALPRQHLDREQIGKVVTNLVLNAREAVTGPGEINVQTSRQNGWAVLSVSDNGCGMSPEFARESLFRPFQTTKKNGIGIGMFQSKMIVEAHRGKIEVETAVGKGTTFRVLLPLTQETK